MQPCEPVAVIGIGCRFPGAEGADGYWELLKKAVDAVVEVPPDRWRHEMFSSASAEPGRTYCRWGGFIERGDWFDAALFGISEHEAEHMDPQQGLLLEVAWQALECAGIAPNSLQDTETGVFIGTSTRDFDRLTANDWRRLEVLSTTGACASITANRLSYVLGCCGPSISVDVACSSSLAAVHLACQSLRTRECELALAGGTYLMLSPANMIAVSQGQVLSLDGRCRSFSETANGYAYGEGCGVIVLKRLERAVQDGDFIWSIIRGSAVKHNGASNGLSAPFRPAIEKMVQQALAFAGVDPASIGYVEAHGSGTLLGDAIEVTALKNVLSEGRASDQPCFIGSVKSNLGHVAASAGIAGLIKTILAIHHGFIPESLYAQPISKYLRLAGTPFLVADRAQPWPSRNTPRRAGVSSFSIGGANAHIVVEQAPAKTIQVAPLSKGASVLPLSALTLSSLRSIAGQYRVYLENLAASPDSHAAFINSCYTAAIGRSHLPYRLAIIADGPHCASLQLQSFLDGQHHAKVLHGQAKRAPTTKLVFDYHCFDDLSVHSDDLPPEWLPQWSMLRNAAVQYVQSNVPPELLIHMCSLAEMLAVTGLLEWWGISPELVQAQDPGGLWIVETIRMRKWQNPILQSQPDSRMSRPLSVSEYREKQQKQRRNLTPNRKSEKLIILSIGNACADSKRSGITDTACETICLKSPWLVSAAAWAYTFGFGPNWEQFFKPVLCSRIPVPTYVFERKRYWKRPGNGLDNALPGLESLRAGDSFPLVIQQNGE